MLLLLLSLASVSGHGACKRAAGLALTLELQIGIHTNGTTKTNTKE